MVHTQSKFYKAEFDDEQEGKKFSALADDWWNPDGKMKVLHRFNPVRIDYIKDTLCKVYKSDPEKDKPLKGLKILDVGCGGGLLSESLHIMGAKVVGIDITDKMIDVARYHAKKNRFAIDYRVQSIDAIAQSGETFDCVLALEVVEHVSDVEGFLTACAKCVKYEGSLFIATINRTIKAYALAIIAAEYILQWLPKGTHHWHKLLKPAEICHIVKAQDIQPKDAVGVVYNLLEDAWKLHKTNLEVNYIMHCIKTRNRFSTDSGRF